MKLLFILALIAASPETANLQTEAGQFISSYLNSIGRLKENEMKDFFTPDLLKRWGSGPLRNLSLTKPLSPKESSVNITNFIVKNERFFLKWTSKKGRTSADSGLPWYVLKKGGRHGFQIDAIDADIDPLSKQR